MPIDITDGVAAEGYQKHAKKVDEYSEALTKTGVQKTVKAVDGARITEVRHTADDAANSKWTEVEFVFERLKNAYTDFPDDITVYLHNDNATPSLGYCYKKLGGEFAFAIFIGPQATRYRRLLEPSKTMARGGLENVGKERLVSDQVYDYYRPTWTIGARGRATRTIVFHEFGHAIHQWKNGDHYFSIANQHTDIANNIGWASIDTTPTKDRHKAILDIGRKGVSSWAGKKDVIGGVNEFVAETFAGLMMGVPYSETVLSCYRDCGGPIPPQGAPHVRTSGRNWPYDETQ